MLGILRIYLSHIDEETGPLQTEKQTEDKKIPQTYFTLSQKIQNQGCGWKKL